MLHWDLVTGRFAKMIWSSCWEGWEGAGHNLHALHLFVCLVRVGWLVIQNAVWLGWAHWDLDVAQGNTLGRGGSSGGLLLFQPPQYYQYQ
jgi:hypothetical protein